MRAFGLVFLVLVALGARGDGLTPAPFRIQEEGTTLALRPKLNFIGTSMTCADDAANARTNCTATGGGGGYDTIQEEGGSLTQRTTLDFVGSAITCADTGSITRCTLSGGGSGLTHPEVMTRTGAFGGF